MPVRRGLTRRAMLSLLGGSAALTAAGGGWFYFGQESPEQRALKEIKTRTDEFIAAIAGGKFENPADYEKFNELFVAATTRIDKRGWELSPAIVKVFQRCRTIGRTYDVRSITSDRPTNSIVFAEACVDPQNFPGNKRFDIEFERVSGKFYVASTHFNFK